MGLLSDLLKDYPALSVAQERIALVEKQYEVMKEENESLKEDAARLMAENASLKTQLRKLQVPEPQGPGELSAIEVQILQIIESEASDEGITAEHVAGSLDESITKAKYYLESMFEHEFVTNTIIMGDDIYYFLDQEGRRYLIEHDLIE